jgi:acyl-CoA reductase-like NAD-dependent aldehyde dehydrogenase
MSLMTAGIARDEFAGREELNRLVAVQRAAFLAGGVPGVDVRKSRIDRLVLAILENADELAQALSDDYGSRPPSVTKAFDELSSVPEAQELRANLAEWMKPVAVRGGFVQRKPLGVVGVVGAWNFPLALTLTPALDALAAGNLVMLKFPDLHVRTGIVLAKAVAARLSEDEVAVVRGDVETAREFSGLALPWEKEALPSREGRRIPPTVLLDVRESAMITDEEVFRPVLVVYPYHDAREVIDYASSRPSPLAAYWYGTDGAEFRRFLDFTTSGGVSRNDGLIGAMAPGAPFGGVGNSGTGAYHGKAGFDPLTHQRTVVAADGRTPRGFGRLDRAGARLGRPGIWPGPGHCRRRRRYQDGDHAVAALTVAAPELRHLTHDEGTDQHGN